VSQTTHETARPTEVRETHVAVVALVGDRAYKIKKPVKLDFVDLTSREERERICHREVELNRRLAPDVYLGVADVFGPDGRPADHLVVMRRMPEDRRLSTLVRDGVDVADDLRSIARTLAEFHSGAARAAGIDRFARVEAIRCRWEDMFETTAPYVGDVLPEETEARVRVLAERYLDGRSRLFEQRIAEGRIRDGHGDLLADDIFCLEDGPRILDCIEFDDTLRYVDVLADVAFLAMDLERVGAPALGARFLRWYRELAGETWPQTLADHYIGFRAHIRSMVACMRAGQGDETAAAGAVQLLDICREHLEWGKVPLVLVGGLPGTGKSTLATALCDRFGWTLLRSDEVRKDLFGVGREDHVTAAFREGMYGEDATRATYDALLARARDLVERGEPVVLDASWTDRLRRAAAADLARETASELVELRCAAPPAVAAERLRHRAAAATDVSDATPEIAAAMAERENHSFSALTVDTAGSFETTFATATAHVRGALRLP
jgi:aminoglycoside phosphotransferase family enzyme/predicted kinase